MFNLQGGELVIILLLALVVLGPEKLPEAMRKAGKFYGEIKKMSTGFQDEFKSTLDGPLKEVRETADLLRDSVDFRKFEAGTRAEKPKSAEMADNLVVPSDPTATPVAATPDFVTESNATDLDGSDQSGTDEPVSDEPVSAEPEPEPVSAEPEPVSAEPEPVSAEPEPVSAEPEPVSAEPEPVSAEPEPVSAEPEPVSHEPVSDEPASPDSASAVADALSDTEIVTPSDATVETSSAPIATTDDEEAAS